MTIWQPDKFYQQNTRIKSDGLSFLSGLPSNFTKLVFFDPQYRSVLDRQNYGNEGERQSGRTALPQMSNQIIRDFLFEIVRILSQSGHLMFWCDKFVLCSELDSLFSSFELKLVDMITWNKHRIGMGYRSRRTSEHLIIFQKHPIRAKNIWTDHAIPDVWDEKLPTKTEHKTACALKGVPVTDPHPHTKPFHLQLRLIEAVTSPGDIVIDPCAGSFSVLTACEQSGRNFLGCDLQPW